MSDPQEDFLSRAEERRLIAQSRAQAEREPNRNRTLPDEEINNRFGYHQGTSTTMPKHAMMREAFKAFAVRLDEALPPGRAKAVAFTQLEETEMWAMKAIAEMAPVVTG